MKILSMTALFIAAVVFQTTLAKTVTMQVSMTAYNSLVAQADGNPFITATGTRTRMGVVAVSRDVLGQVGYRATARIVRYLPSRGCDQRVMPSSLRFVVEDTTSSRLWRTMDIWLPSRSQSLQFGRCTALVEFSY